MTDATQDRAARDCECSEEDVRAYLHDILCPLCNKYPWEHETAAQKRAKQKVAK